MKQISNFKSLISARKGFTLIELLIVIAVLGILAAVVLVAIDPVEQLAKGRDSSRKTTVGQMGRALQAYYTGRSSYPTSGEWTAAAATNALVVSGEIKALPPASAPNVVVGCTAAAGFTAGLALDYCYKVMDPPTYEFIFYTKVESRSERTKGGCPNSGDQTWFLYSSFDGRAGILCLAAATEPTPQSYADAFL